MSESTHADNMSVYEIGYLIVSSIPEEKVPAEAEVINKIITSSKATIIAEEAPHRMKLAYEMRKKNVGGTYEKYNEAYFGWTKFEVGSDAVEAIKKAVEIHPTVLRMLLVSTVRENTYLGKRAPAIAAEISLKKDGEKAEAPVADKKEAAPASIEEMDKSIDEMVKEV
ncbi:MAG TPA: 30S ribosomal protein S6 [Candidatus Paceibacterota bacterium]|jgi:ribosomal protein S6|nr:30S ribosomal protein S6 [Candidatus Paceibacterota bacterium]